MYKKKEYIVVSLQHHQLNGPKQKAFITQQIRINFSSAKNKHNFSVSLSSARTHAIVLLYHSLYPSLSLLLSPIWVLFVVWLSVNIQMRVGYKTNTAVCEHPLAPSLRLLCHCRRSRSVFIQLQNSTAVIKKERRRMERFIYVLLSILCILYTSCTRKQ